MNAEPIRIPVEVTTPPPVFDTVARGYDRAQVDEYLLRVEQELAEVSWQRDWLTSREADVEQERERLAKERGEWEAERDDWNPTFAALGDRAQLILRYAQEEADVLREKTVRDCDERREQERVETATARQALEKEVTDARSELRRDLELMRVSAESEAASIVHQARQDADTLLAEARHEAETIRLRAVEYLAAARQERGKTAALLEDLGQRLTNTAERLAVPAEEEPDPATPATAERAERTTGEEPDPTEPTGDGRDRARPPQSATGAGDHQPGSTTTTGDDTG